MNYTATGTVSCSNLKKNVRGHKRNITQSREVTVRTGFRFETYKACAAGRESMSVLPMIRGSFGDRDA
jgi:hypothetical protein